MAINREKVKKQGSVLQAGTAFAQLKPGNNDWIFLPLKEDPETFFHPVGKHWVDLGEDSFVNIVCPKTTPVLNDGEPGNCPICRLLMPAARKALSEKDARRLGVSKRAYCLIVDTKNLKAGVQVATVPAQVINDMISFLGADDDDEIAYPIADDATPCIVRIERKGQGLGTRYTVVPGKPIPISKLAKKMGKTTKELLDSRPDLVELIKTENATSLEEFTRAVLKWRPELVQALPASFKEQVAALPAPDEEDEDLPEGWDEELLDKSKGKGDAIDVEFDELDDDEDEEPPECFGKEYDPEDEDCEECELVKSCKAAFEKPKKKKRKKRGKKGKKAAKKPGKTVKEEDMTEDEVDAALDDLLG